MNYPLKELPDSMTELAGISTSRGSVSTGVNSAYPIPTTSTAPF
ncbi:MAG: hypothetical protein QMD14_05215 [Candidatus Aenigmarchaeota archaeon]|nr:hypothetical protein [Candidatus Aenigmarchaeota archaeon]